MTSSQCQKMEPFYPSLAAGVGSVRSPREALDCFLCTKLDVLVVGDHLIERAA